MESYFLRLVRALADVGEPVVMTVAKQILTELSEEVLQEVEQDVEQDEPVDSAPEDSAPAEEPVPAEPAPAEPVPAAPVDDATDARLNSLEAMVAGIAQSVNVLVEGQAPAAS
jgi:hypothetical protein